MKALKNISLTIFCLVSVVLAFVFWINSSAYGREVITIKASAVNEDCDMYDHLWRVDSVSDEEFNFLVGELLYSKDVAEYQSAHQQNGNKGTEKLIATGQVSKSTIMEEFVCSDAWFFQSHEFEVTER